MDVVSKIKGIRSSHFLTWRRCLWHTPNSNFERVSNGFCHNNMFLYMNRGDGYKLRVSNLLTKVIHHVWHPIINVSLWLNTKNRWWHCFSKDCFVLSSLKTESKQFHARIDQHILVVWIVQLWCDRMSHQQHHLVMVPLIFLQTYNKGYICYHQHE